MPSITIRVDGTTATAGENARIVCGNSDYSLNLFFDSEWPDAARVITINGLSTEGEKQTITFTANNDHPDLPTISNAYILRVHIASGSMQTTVPAIIFCDACVTDASGTEAAQRPDIYNMASEYIACRTNGESAQAEAILAQLAALTPPPAFPGSAYRLTAVRPQRTTKLTGALTVGTTEIALDSDSIVSDSVSIAWTATPSDFLLPGGVPTAELRCTIRTDIAPESLYGAQIALTYHILRPDVIRTEDDPRAVETWEGIPLGTFDVAEAAADTETGVTITAYDGMMKIERVPRGDLPFASDTAYTPQEIITAIAQAAGVAYTGDLSDLPVRVRDYNAVRGYFVNRADTSIATARDLLSCIAQTLNALAFVDRFGELRIRPIAKTDPVADYDANARMSNRISRLPYRLLTLKTVVEMRGSDGSAVVHDYESQTLWADGVTAELPENPLWSVIDGTYSTAEQSLNIITQALDPVTFAPGEATILGDPSLDPLDWVRVNGADLPVTAFDWHFRGEHTITACGADAVAGIARSQAEKAALAERRAQVAGADNLLRTASLMTIQSAGHAAMALHDHEWLAHFTHGELAGKEIT